MVGYILQIVDKIEINNSQSEPPQETKIISQSPKETQTTETNKPWYKKLANFFFELFKRW